MLLNCGVGKTLESPLNCKEIQPVNAKGNQSWIFIRRADAETETPIFLPPHEKHWLIWKHPDSGKDWRREEKGTTVNEMVGWHHQQDIHEFGWAPGVGDGQGGLVCYSPWGRKELDTTEWLEWNWNWKLLQELEIVQSNLFMQCLTCIRPKTNSTTCVLLHFYN